MSKVKLALKQIADVKTNMEDADFWIQRKGSKLTCGSVRNFFTPDNIGIKVKYTDLIDRKYLKFMLEYLHKQYQYTRETRGTLTLQHIAVDTVKNIQIEMTYDGYKKLRDRHLSTESFPFR